MSKQERRAAALLAAAILVSRGIGTGPDNVERLTERFERFIQATAPEEWVGDR